MQYTDKRNEFFLDGLSCVSSTNCFALSDPVNGKLLVFHTENGKSWKELPRDKMPEALPKEGSFAASNTSLLVTGKQELFFGTGGPAARIFNSNDNGKVGPSWKIFAGARRRHYCCCRRRLRTTGSQGTVGGVFDRSWKNMAIRQDLSGYRSMVVKSDLEFIAVGLTGTDVSRDGVDWLPVESIPLNAVAFDYNRGWGIRRNNCGMRAEEM